MAKEYIVRPVQRGNVIETLKSKFYFAKLTLHFFQELLFNILQYCYYAYEGIIYFKVISL